MGRVADDDINARFANETKDHPASKTRYADADGETLLRATMPLPGGFTHV